MKYEKPWMEKVKRAQNCCRKGSLILSAYKCTVFPICSFVSPIPKRRQFHWMRKTFCTKMTRLSDGKVREEEKNWNKRGKQNRNGKWSLEKFLNGILNWSWVDFNAIIIETKHAKVIHVYMCLCCNTPWTEVSPCRSCKSVRILKASTDCVNSYKFASKIGILFERSGKYGFYCVSLAK